jgi:protocatechuate 3,4-dioxygenase beta subunit
MKLATHCLATVAGVVLHGAVEIERRRFLQWAAALPVLAPVVLAACRDGGEAGPGAADSAGSPASRPATPACGEATIEETEGPFYSDGPPERTDIRAGADGTNLVVSGQVVDTACAPVSGAILDFWQADDGGEYDNQGYTLRGWQRADAEGRFILNTIVPGVYPGRTRHIHVKVQAADAAPVLTTQLYFPDEPMNDNDTIFDPTLVMDVSGDGAGRRASFDFVLER